MISSTLTFWVPVVIMLSVYYKVFKEAMKQKQNMERMNNIRTLPVTNNLTKSSFESDKTTHELLGLEKFVCAVQHYIHTQTSSTIFHFRAV